MWVLRTRQGCLKARRSLLRTTSVAIGVWRALPSWRGVGVEAPCSVMAPTSTAELQIWVLRIWCFSGQKFVLRSRCSVRRHHAYLISLLSTAGPCLSSGANVAGLKTGGLGHWVPKFPQKHPGPECLNLANLFPKLHRLLSSMLMTCAGVRERGIMQCECQLRLVVVIHWIQGAGVCLTTFASIACGCFAAVCVLGVEEAARSWSDRERERETGFHQALQLKVRSSPSIRGRNECKEMEEDEEKERRPKPRHNISCSCSRIACWDPDASWATVMLTGMAFWSEQQHLPSVVHISCLLWQQHIGNLLFTCFCPSNVISNHCPLAESSFMTMLHWRQNISDVVPGKLEQWSSWLSGTQPLEAASLHAMSDSIHPNGSAKGVAGQTWSYPWAGSCGPFFRPVSANIVHCVKISWWLQVSNSHYVLTCLLSSWHSLFHTSFLLFTRARMNKHPLNLRFFVFPMLRWKRWKHRKRRARSMLNYGPEVRIGIAKSEHVKLWPAFPLPLRKEAFVESRTWRSLCYHEANISKFVWECS